MTRTKGTKMEDQVTPVIEPEQNDNAVDLGQLQASLEALSPEQLKEAREKLRHIYRPERDEAIRKHAEEEKRLRLEVESLKTAGLSEIEKAKREAELAREEAKAKDAELRDRDAEIIAREVAEQTGLPAAFRQYIKTPDREEALSRAKEISKAIEAHVSAKVKEVIAGATHAPAQSKPALGMVTRDQLKSMSNAEIIAAFNENRIVESGDAK